MEVGVEVASPLGPVDGILSVVTPACEVAMAVHKGPYSALGGAHEAVVRCGHANGWWEIYGDWQEGAAQLHTEVGPLRGPPLKPSVGRTSKEPTDGPSEAAKLA